MITRKLMWFLVAVVVLSMSSSAAADDVKSVFSWGSRLQRVSMSVTESVSAQPVVPLTSEMPVTGSCTGRFNVWFRDLGYAELCPMQYSLEVPHHAIAMLVELELGAAGRNIHLAVAFGDPIGPGVSFWVIRDFGKPLEFNSSIMLFRRPDLETRTAYIAVFNFEPRPQEYTLVASLTPNPLRSGISWSGSITDRTIGGREPRIGELLGFVDYTIGVPAGAPSLVVELSNRGPGDINLYVRFGSPVDIVGGRVVADCSSDSPRPTETCTITPPRAGTYFIKVGNREASRQLFTLTATVGPAVLPPTIGVSPSSFSFSAQVGGPNPPSQTLTITNTGGGTLSWSATTNVPWLSVSPTSGSAPPPSSVTVSVSIAGLPAGTHSGLITITAPGATNTPQTVPVTLTLAPAPIIQVTPGSLSFSAVQGGPSPPAQTLTIANAGGGTLSWTASANVPWLSVSPTSGSAPPPSSVTVSVSIAGLPVGTHAGLITITAPGAINSPLTVPVTLTITAPPTIGVSPSSFSFSAQVGGPNPPSQTLTITNTGGGTLSWSATTNVPWLSVSPTSGTAPSSVTVSVTITGLPAGTHSGLITITAPGATNSPLTVPVTLTITAPPPPAGLFVLKFIKLEFVDPAAWERTLKEGCVVYKNISGKPSKIKVTLPDKTVLEFDIPPAKEAIVCGDVVHIDTRGYSPLSVPVTLTITTPPPPAGLFVLKFIKLEFVDPAAWERTLKEGCVIYKNISGAPSKIKVTLPDTSVLEFDIPAAKEVIVCGDVVHIDTRS